MFVEKHSGVFSSDICVKGALAVLSVLQALPESVCDWRFGVRIDSMGFFHAWSGFYDRKTANDVAHLCKSLNDGGHQYPAFDFNLFSWF